MGAVFDSINRGMDVTKGLKKVDASMKTKNMKDAPVLVPKEKKTEASAKKFAKTEEKKAATLALTKGTWFCENYDGETLEIPNVEIKHSVYILKARNCTITVPDKCKSISADGCFKTRIVFRSVVSNFELFNSQRCVVECTDVFPCVAIDKSNGCIVILSRAGMAAPPQIVTSNISECNITVPGARDEDDPIEIPIPEQFETTLVPGGPPHKLRTHPTAHGD
jgi:adenylyl cyclase-associated protein